MVRINGNENANNSKAGKMTDDEYVKKQDALKAKIKPTAESVEDLKNAKKIKEEQIQLARSHGDFGGAKMLGAELEKIEADIRKNTSIFS